MAQQIINVGAAPNDGQGDPIRTSFIKCNNNFGELYSRLQDQPPVTLVGSVGDVAGMTAYDSDFYYYCFQDFDGSSVIWRQVPNALDAQVTALSATGNVTANVFIGDGSQLTNVVAGVGSRIANGTSNVEVNLNGNITLHRNGVLGAGLITISGTPAWAVPGIIACGGNLRAANIAANTFVVAGDSVIGNLVIANIGMQTNTLSLTGNILSNANINGSAIIAGNLSIGGNVNTAIYSASNITGGNILTPGQVSAVGNVTGSFLFGDGGFISNVTSISNVAATQLANGTTVLTVAGSGGNVTFTVGAVSNVMVVTNAGANVNGYVNTTGNVDAANVTSTNRILATGNVTGGNLTTSGIVSATGNVTGLNVIAIQTMSAAGNIVGGNLTTGGLANVGSLSVVGTSALSGNITTPITVLGNITTTNSVSVATAVTTGTLSASGNVTGGNIISNGLITAVGNVNCGNIYTTGRIVSTDDITGQNFTTSGGVTATGNVVGGTIATGGTISAVGNITGGNLSIGGNILGGNISVNSGTITVGSIVNANANGVGNIGNATGYFNTIFAKATSAQYADLAERYLADAEYEPGTVLEFGGTKELTLCDRDQSPEVAGVVSSQPAYEMNTGLSGQHSVALALVGRVPCRVMGKVWPGAMMVSAGQGRARAERSPAMGTVIGKALQAFDGVEGIIEIVVGRL